MTALCITRNRRQWLPKAIQCFQAQTYPNKELLILADGDDVRDLIPNDERIRLVHIDEGYKIGEKHNFGSSLANGEIIATWDDDDWSAPSRITDQVERLEQSGLAVTGYWAMYFTNGTEWWRYKGRTYWPLGTSLCYRKSWWERNPFPPAQIYEDGEFRNRAEEHKQLIGADAGELMVATIHPNNTSPRQCSGDNWKRVDGFAGVPGYV